MSKRKEPNEELASRREYLKVGGTNPLSTSACPGDAVPTLYGPCLDRSRDEFTPHNRWYRRHPGGQVIAWEDDLSRYPHPQWNLFSYYHPGLRCAQRCYGVSHRFACLHNCKARYGY